MPDLQDSILGSRGYSFGPGVLYFDTSTGFVPAGYTGETGTGTFLGRTGPIEWSEALMEVDLTSIQTGSAPDDFGVTGGSTDISVILKEARTDVISKIMRGVYVDKDTADQPLRIYGSTPLGQRGRDVAKQLTFVEIFEGAEAWDDPFKVVDFFVAITRFPDTKLMYDAATQRELAVKISCLESRTMVDPLNRPARWATRSQTQV